jgi:hypothetical protein
MANLNGKYDPNAEAQQDLGKLPTGEYLAVIVDSDIKPTSQNNGEYAEFVYEVIEPAALKGRKHWERVTLDNPNTKAVEIGQRQFASIREATGVANPRDTQELHNKPHIIRVEFYPAGSEITHGSKKGQKRDRDEATIKAWKRVEGGAGNVSAPTIGAASSATAQSPSDSVPPWKRAAA